MTRPIRITFLSLLLLSLTSFSQEKYEADKVAKWSIVDALKEFSGSAVTLHLSSGTSVTGTLSPIKILNESKAVYLTKITGKEFYGALIDLKQIVGVEFYNKAK